MSYRHLRRLIARITLSLLRRVSNLKQALSWALPALTLLCGTWGSAHAEDLQLRLAKLTRDEIAAQQKELDTALFGLVKVVDDSITAFEPAKLGDPHLTLKAFKPLVSELRQLSNSLSEKEAKYVEALRSYRSKIQSAPQIYRTAGKMFREYAAEEPIEDFKRDYILLAETWEGCAEYEEARVKLLAPNTTSEIQAFQQYLARSAILLERLESHIDSLPDFGDDDQRAVYIAQLQRYVRGFEELRRLFRTFHEKLRSGSGAKSPAAAAKARLMGTDTFVGCPIKTDDGHWGGFRERSGFSPRKGDVLTLCRNGAAVGKVTVHSIDRGVVVVLSKPGEVMTTGDYALVGAGGKSLLEEIEDSVARSRSHQLLTKR